MKGYMLVLFAIVALSASMPVDENMEINQDGNIQQPLLIVPENVAAEESLNTAETAHRGYGGYGGWGGGGWGGGGWGGGGWGGGGWGGHRGGWGGHRGHGWGR